MNQSHPHSIATSRFCDASGYWEYEHPHNPSGYDPQTLQVLPRNLLVVSYNANASPAQSRFERMTFLLDYIRRVIDSCRDTTSGPDAHGRPIGDKLIYPTPPPANVIMLQEVTREGFDAILSDRWTQDYYQVVPSSPWDWSSERVPGLYGEGPGKARSAEYGNVVLVTRSLPVMRPKIIYFADTTEHRAAVIFDTLLGAPRHPRRSHTHQQEKSATAKIRLACTQLESGQLGVFSRRHQLETISSEILDNSIDGAVLGGDMTVAHFGDIGMPKLVGLLDAERRAEDDSTSFTWGYHPGRSGEKPCRRDKILYWQNRKRFFVNEVRTLGIGLRMQNGRYVTEHYGIMTSLEPFE